MRSDPSNGLSLICPARSCTSSMTGDNVITDGKVDWRKLKQQLTDIRSNTTIKAGIPWFDDWMKLEDQTKELFQWSKHLNENLHLGLGRH